MPLVSRSYQYQLVLLLASSQALAYISRVNLSVVGPTLVKSGHFTPAALGLLFSIFNWSFTVALLASGPFADKVRARIAFPLGVGLWSLGTMLCGLTMQFVPLAFLRGLVGIGEGPMIPSGAQVIRENFPKEQRATIVGTFFSGNKIGLMVGIPLSSAVYVYAGWIGTFLITGGIGLLWIVWWFAVYRTNTTAMVTAAGHPPSGIRWSTLLRYRTTWGIMLGQAGYLYIYYVFATWLPGYLVLQRHMSIETTGLVGIIPFLVGAICVVLGGWAGDHLIRQGYRVTRVRKGFAVGGLLAATIFTVLGAYAQDTTLAIALLTSAVGAMSLATASVNSMPIDVAPPNIVSSLVSLQNFGGNVGGSFAPIITGLLISASGNFAVPLLVTAGVALVFGCGSFGLIVGSLDRELSLSMLDGSKQDRTG